ncbi:hypothetical protein TKK_0019097 [Trichogramma kaykai]
MSDDSTAAGSRPDCEDQEKSSCGTSSVTTTLTVKVEKMSLASDDEQNKDYVEAQSVRNEHGCNFIIPSIIVTEYCDDDDDVVVD